MATEPARHRLSRLAVPLLLVLAACAGPAPRPLVEGRDVCDHCHMTLADRRFGGELVARTGRVTPFDDVGCLAMGVLAADTSRVHSLWVTDYLAPDSAGPVAAMTFLRTDRVRTPMGYGIVATRPGPAADSLTIALGAIRMDWPGVLAWARDSGSR